MTSNRNRRYKAIEARLMPWFEGAVCLVTLICVLALAVAVGFWVLAVIGALWLAAIPLRLMRVWGAK